MGADDEKIGAQRKSNGQWFKVVSGIVSGLFLLVMAAAITWGITTVQHVTSDRYTTADAARDLATLREIITNARSQNITDLLRHEGSSGHGDVAIDIAVLKNELGRLRMEMKELREHIKAAQPSYQ